jgi:Domain of unknown function (DUF397)
VSVGWDVPVGRDDVDRALRWRKASQSYSNGNCVEIALAADGVAVRDSKDRGGPALRFTPDEWRAFVAGVKGGEFDLA